MQQRPSKGREGGEGGPYLGRWGRTGTHGFLRVHITSLGAQIPPCSLPSSREGGGDIPCVLQDCSSPESIGCLEPKRPGGSEAASGSQEKLDFNQNLKEGKMSALAGGGPGAGGVRSATSHPLVSSSCASHREAAVQ